MKKQKGSKEGDHCVPVRSKPPAMPPPKATVSKPPPKVTVSKPPPKATVSKPTKKTRVVKSVVQKEVETVSSDSSDSDDSDHMEEAATCGVPLVTRKRKRTSKAWNEFIEIYENGKVTHGKCKHCGKKIGAESANGTSSLRKHLKCCMTFKATQPQISQMFFKASEMEDGPVAAFHFKFNHEVTRDCIARMIILHELPFSFVEYIGFRRVLTSLQPNIKLVKRNTTKSDCMKIFKLEKKHLYETFDKIQSRISLTTDMWTCTTQNKGYMALTAHYVDEQWKIQKRILSFSTINGQHTGVNIAKVVMEQLYEWNIDRKISSITLDNASTNGVVVEELSDQLKQGNGLLLNGELFHIRCAAHVIAIIVDHGMLEIKEEIQRIRNSVKYIRGSPQRQEKFLEVCLQVNAPKKKLVQDVDTRWNSTYLMIATALQFREAFIRFAKIEPDFLKVAPTAEDWKNASSLSTCLKVFYDVTVLFSGNIPRNDVNMKDSVSVGGSSGSTSTSQSSFTSRRKGLAAFLEESSQQDAVRTDLEQYLAADILPSGSADLDDSSFDVLGWWKFHGPVYPILALIARDILAIPASSVASESVFSTSGRVVDKFRSSMHSETIEALICAQDWIRSALKNEGLGLGDTSLQTVLEAEDELQSDDEYIV